MMGVGKELLSINRMMGVGKELLSINRMMGEGKELLCLPKEIIPDQPSRNRVYGFTK